MLIAVPFPVEDQAVLSFVDPGAEALSPEEDSKFKRHVEPRQVGARIQLGARDVVETKATTLHEFKYPIDPDLTGIGDFKGTMRDIAAIGDCEDQRVKERPVSLVEWTINEDAEVIVRLDPARRLTSRASPRALRAWHVRPS